MPFLTRYDDDRSAPGALEALRDLVVRAVLPALVVLAALAGLGWLLTDGPLSSVGRDESSVNRSLVADRTPGRNTATMLMSHVGNTEYVIGVCLLVVAVVWWRTREWWFAVVPLVAISLQASVFVATTMLIDRPRPPVPHLDPAPPTSSFPSGHVGASTALYAACFLMAVRLRNRVLRVAVRVLCVLAVAGVVVARLYRGMHHPSDVLAGLANGLVCALLAWGWVRREEPAAASRGQTRA
jgi:undecaprenyl-diphosphatase